MPDTNASMEGKIQQEFDGTVTGTTERSLRFPNLHRACDIVIRKDNKGRFRFRIEDLDQDDDDGSALAISSFGYHSNPQVDRVIDRLRHLMTPTSVERDKEICVKTITDQSNKIDTLRGDLKIYKVGMAECRNNLIEAKKNNEHLKEEHLSLIHI